MSKQIASDSDTAASEFCPDSDTATSITHKRKRKSKAMTAQHSQTIHRFRHPHQCSIILHSQGESDASLGKEGTHIFKATVRQNLLLAS
jgi:hypothetical protein